MQDNQQGGNVQSCRLEHKASPSMVGRSKAEYPEELERRAGAVKGAESNPDAQAVSRALARSQRGEDQLPWFQGEVGQRLPHSSLAGIYDKQT